MTRRPSGDGALFWSPAKQRWIVRVVVDGRRVTRQRKTRRDAVRVLRLMQAGQVQRRATRERLGDYLTRWLSEQAALGRYAPNTVRTYRSLIPVVAQALGHRALDGTTPAHLQSFIARAAGEYKPSSVQLIRAMLSAALKDAAYAGLIADNPMRKTRGPKVVQAAKEAPSAADVAALIERFEPPYQGIVVLAAHLGLRQSEVAGLRWQDIDDSTLTIAGQLARDGTWTPQRKAEGNLVFPLIGVLSRALARQRAYQAAQRLRAGSGWHGGGTTAGYIAGTTDYIFTNGDGTPIRQWQISAAFTRALSGSGLPFRTFHDLRHAANSLLDALGVDQGTRMAVLGHAALRTNLLYTHTSAARLREGLERLERAIGEG